MKYWGKLIFAAFFLLQFLTLNAQDYLFDIQRLNIEDGLPDRRVFSVDKDKDGYIWLSTIENGVYRYDGVDFKDYGHLLDSVKIEIPFIVIDAKDNLWVFECPRSDDKGSCSIIAADRKKAIAVKDFTNGSFGGDDVRIISRSTIDPQTIFIATKQGGIYKYDGRFEVILEDEKSVYGADLKVFDFSSDGFYYVIKGECLLKVKDKQILHCYQFDRNTAPMESYVLHDLIRWGERMIVVGKYFDTSEKLYFELKDGHLVPSELKNDLEISYGDLYIINEDFACYENNKQLVIRSHQGDTLAQSAGFSKSIFGVVNNRLAGLQNRFWLTSENGLYKINSKKNPFKLLAKGNSIRGIIQNGNELWVGSYAGNLIIDLETGAEKALDDPLKNQVVNNFLQDHDGNVWAALAGDALLKYDKVSGDSTRYVVPTADNVLFENSSSLKLWLGTASGLYYFDKLKKKVFPCRQTKELNLSVIRHFHESENDIWVASKKGLTQIDLKTDSLIRHFTKADGLPDHNLNFIHEDNDGIFWLASKKHGLIRWDRQQHKFLHFTRENGLSNNTIYAIYEDSNGYLWMPSNFGLMRFDKNAHSTRTYLPTNGIAHEEFNTHAHFRATDGTFYFGGLDGINCFHPDSLQTDKSNQVKLTLSKIFILEKGESVFSDKTDHFYKTENIVLEPGDQILRIEVSLLNYENESENQYAYRMKGYQNNWVYTDDHKISLINLPYGNYNIEVKAKGPSGGWSDIILEIPVSVKTPFYLRWQFFAMLFAFVAGMVMLWSRWRINKLEKDKTRLEEEVRKRTHTISEQAEALKKLDKAKTRFFSNITHEFRTPLTLIIGPLEQFMAKTTGKEARSKLAIVLNNAKHLLTLINQLLDLSKLEVGKMDTEIARGDIVAYTRELTERFRPMTTAKQQTLRFIPDREMWETHFDHKKWDKVIYNLLSNAIKFTPEHGTITVQLSEINHMAEPKIQLKVMDTGTGMNADTLDHIFDRFYQADGSSTRTQEGTGIGLALVKELVETQKGEVRVDSKIGQGTTFEILLPVLQQDADGIKELSALEVNGAVHDFTEPVMPESEQVHAVKGSSDEKDKLVLLIIEDNQQMQAYIRSCLDEALYYVHTADNGEEGIAKAKEIIPDLIISDIMMPGKDGFEVTKAIRNDIATSHIPLILLTARASLDSRLEGLQRGADAYLTKPFSPRELVLRIRKLIELRKQLQQRYQQRELPEPEEAFEKEDAFIIELKKYIAENIQSELSVEQVSKSMAMSRAQLYRKIKALTDQPLSVLIRNIRLNTAMQLIQEKELNLTEIADATGFSSLSHFSRTFKKHFGKTPSEMIGK